MAFKSTWAITTLHITTTDTYGLLCNFIMLAKQQQTRPHSKKCNKAKTRVTTCMLRSTPSSNRWHIDLHPCDASCMWRPKLLGQPRLPPGLGVLCSVGSTFPDSSLAAHGSSERHTGHWSQLLHHAAPLPRTAICSNSFTIYNTAGSLQQPSNSVTCKRTTYEPVSELGSLLSSLGCP